MKILFLPKNIASLQSTTAEALNRIDGIEAVCLTQELSKYNSINESVVYIPKPLIVFYKPMSLILNWFKYRKRIRKWIEWADVIHYVWGPALKNGKDVKWASAMKKPLFIEWVGSDIRNPELLSGNKFYCKVFDNGYEYRNLENSNYKSWVQSLFARVGAIPTLLPEMSLFLDKKLFPNFLLLPHRIDVKNYIPFYPSIKTDKPLIVHSPTAKIGKGSSIIIPIMSELSTRFNFDFVLLHEKSREEVISLMQKADIFIDQIIVGGYGMASCEAMALGKPVMCYILQEVYDAGLPRECPIINVNPDTLKEKLIDLLENPALRRDIGIRSREFVESYNDADRIAKNLVDMYKRAKKKSES